MSKRSSLKASLLDGIFASIMLGFTANYITPYAVCLGAMNFHVGLINSVPQLLGAIVQIKSAELASRMKSRVRTVSVFIYLQAATFMMLPLLFFITGKALIMLFTAIITLNTVFGNISAPVWASLMSDTIKPSDYCDYFAWRGKMLGIITLVSTFIAGVWLYFADSKLIGFCQIFIAAGIARAISGYFLSKMDDVPVEMNKNRDFSYWEFIKRAPESNFVKFVLFVSFVNFATFIAGPFFAVYMLKELNFGYIAYTSVTSANVLAALFSLPFWGRLSDKYGNVRVIKSSAAILPFLPFLWLFSSNAAYLTIVNGFAGYMWAGFNLAIVNFIFDAASPDVRTKCIAYFNFTTGLFIFLGALSGGWLTGNIPGFISGSRILTVIVLSGILRLMVNYFFIRSFNEVRKTNHIDDKQLFYTLLGLVPVMNISSARNVSCEGKESNEK